MDKLQRGNRKWLRRLKLRDSSTTGGGGVVEKRSSSIVADGRTDLSPVPSSQISYRKRREKDCTSIMNEDGWGRSRRVVIALSLSSKEKDEDFMKIKGCKLSQRPRRRAKSIQRSISLLSPGGWLWDVCHERYQVREKKACNKKPNGLKAMESSMEMDYD